MNEQVAVSEQLSSVAEIVEHSIDQLNVKGVFGEPVKEGDVTIIPIAEITLGFGLGYGSGRGFPSGEEEKAEDEPEPAPPVEGRGAGGGGGGGAKPRGFIKITPEGVKFESILDETRIAIAGIAMSAWSVFWVIWGIRGIGRAMAKSKALALGKK